MQPTCKWFLVLCLITLTVAEVSARATSAIDEDRTTIGINSTAEYSLHRYEQEDTVRNTSSKPLEIVSGIIGDEGLAGKSDTTEASFKMRSEEENANNFTVNSPDPFIKELEVSEKQFDMRDQMSSMEGKGDELEQKDVQDYLSPEDEVEEKTYSNITHHLTFDEEEDVSLEQETAYDHTSVEVEHISVDNIERSFESVHAHAKSTVVNNKVLTENSEIHLVDPLETKSDVFSEKNERIARAEAMTSEVQVDDFMKSRVAYHNAVASDITGVENDPESEKDKLEELGLPEKLTMEETIGEVWKEETNNEKPEMNDGVVNVDIRNHLHLDEPQAYKLMKSDQAEPEEEVSQTQNVLNESYFDTTEPSSTTDMRVTQFTKFDESTHDYLDKLEQPVSVSNQPNVIDEARAEETTESDKESQDHTASDYDDNPVAERLYAYGINKGKDTSILDNNLEDSSEKHLKSSLSQSFRDYKDISEEDVIEVQNLLPDHPSFKKEKIEPGVLFEECIDCDFRVLPIRPSEQRDLPKMEEEPLPSPTVRFLDLPEGRELQIYSLDLSEGFFLFGYLSEFLSWIQPNEFPVELLRDALRSQITWISLITQSLHVEAGFVACLVAGVLLALAVPVVVLWHACYRMTSRDDDEMDDKLGWAGNCRRRTLVFILQILLILLLGGMVAMFVTNEQLSDAVVKSSDVIQASLSDVSTFVHNSHLQLHFLVTQSLDQTLQAIYADLDNVDELLGRPIQRELVRETGIDVALESLVDLTKEAKETTQQVDRLLDEVRVVQEMVVATTDKLSDLRQQVELFRRACGPRDRTLCDTIDATGLEVTLQMNKLKSDERLHRMRRMGGVALEAAVNEAKARFMSVPARVDADTRDAREAARRQLMRQRTDVDDRSLALERLVREMTGKVSEAKYQAGFWMQDLDQFEYWRWIVCMGGGAAVFMVWTMLLFSLCCGCCGSEKAAGPTILVTIVLVCLLSTVLWSIALVGMMFGGHGEVFVCRPLYDEPDYHVISRLVDQPGVFYSEPRGGFIANVIYGNDTLDVPIRQVLEECRENHALYPTLGLGRVFDVEAAVDQHRWASVSTQLRSVRANLSSLEVLSPTLQDQLGDLLATLSVNFTEHRIQMSRPVTAKDMDSFARQLDNIGNQMRDLAVASRMETLSTRTRRLIDSHIRPLEGRKDALVYQLTALEVQTGPLQRQVNQSLSHLKTIQFFINSQGESIAQRKSRQYVDRLLNYVEQLRRHVTDTVSSSVAPCRPLWDIFNTTRLFLCRHTMDPLNGYWFASMWCLMVLLVATPVCLKLVDYYRARGSRSSGSPSENLMGSEQGAAWSSPGYDIKYSKDDCNGNCKQ